MEQTPREAPDVLFETGMVEYDPLTDFASDEEEVDESDGQQGPNTEFQAKALYIPKPDNRSASQRIEDLFTVWATRRRVLLEILQFLDTPRRADALDDKVAKLQENDVSVFSGYNYSLLLAEAGAIIKVNEDGSVFDEEAEQLPDIVEIEGARFYKPTDGKQVFWLITDEGRAYLETDDPFGRLAELIATESPYETIYKRVLEFCDSETGRSAEELADLIDGDPLVQNPRKYFSYFAKKLEDCGALVWKKKWETSELGSRGLELLFDKDAGRRLEEQEGQSMGGIGNGK